MGWLFNSSPLKVLLQERYETEGGNDGNSHESSRCRHNSPGNAALRRGRYSEPNRIYLVTACTNRREPLFQDWRIGRLVVAEMRRLHELSQVESLAWVVMPDHWHWLLQLGEMIDLARVMNATKERSAIAVNRSLGRTGPVW